MLKAIIFDFDGTILDTETPDYHSWNSIFVDHGCELEQDAWCQVVGTNWDHFNPFDHLEQKIGRSVARDQLWDLHKERFHALVKQQVPLPGVEALLKQATELGLKLAVASSSQRQWVQGHLERLELLEYFPVVASADDVEKVKPDPVLYRVAVERLGVTPAAAMAIEDSVNGVRAAKAAGLRCVAVPNSVTKNLDFSMADEVLETLNGCVLETLIRRW